MKVIEQVITGDDREVHAGGTMMNVAMMGNKTFAWVYDCNKFA